MGAVDSVLAENHVRGCAFTGKEEPGHMGQSLDMTGFFNGGSGGIRTHEPLA